MTDHEMLELAAKAAGIERGADRLDCGVSITLPDGRHDSLPRWNPLTDDGDALRLAVALQLHLDFRPGFVGVHRGRGPYIGECPRDHTGDGAVTRRAIVRAAAEIGMAMP